MKAERQHEPGDGREQLSLDLLEAERRDQHSDHDQSGGLTAGELSSERHERILLNAELMLRSSA